MGKTISSCKITTEAFVDPPPYRFLYFGVRRTLTDYLASWFSHSGLLKLYSAEEKAKKKKREKK